LRKDTEPMSPPFDAVLVANRGEIALRIMRACRQLGIRTVAVYSDVDAGAAHVRFADEARRIGPPPAAESYLRVDAIVQAALDSGAQAIHPGYGFLSERPELAEACARSGLAFVGPAPATLRALGDKLAARRVAAEVGVPIVPGTLEPLNWRNADRSLLEAEADRVGWPLLIKAAAGGGGRGMRRLDGPLELHDALAAAAREAEAAFGDGAVYLERYVEGARHVEVQLLGDEAGQVIALGERDCSVQRRHQKLVEEAPAPGLSAAQRADLHRLAVTVAQSVGLCNAATAEFLLTSAGETWFLEVNARLQVEHGVTELVFGVDLVVEQLRIAAGKPLSEAVLAAAARAAEPQRHAIEVRLSAEDPANGFAPRPGRITRWHEPVGADIRVDSGVAEGSAVPPDYDPLLAKLMVVGTDRPAALALLADALAELEVGGVQTTLPFHRWLVEQPLFATAEGLSTEFVARHWQPAELVSVAAVRAAELAARAYALGTGRPRSPVPVARDGAAAAWWLAGINEAIGEGRR
jgi:acetyl/propionyl-CoA carboxylase alpha subunit